MNLSWLTEIERSVKVGKLINASHLLLHKKDDSSLFATTYPLRLLNVKTMEVEFAFTPSIWKMHERTEGRWYILAMASIAGRFFYNFLNVLNRHAANTDGKEIYVVTDGEGYLEIERRGDTIYPGAGMLP